MEKILKISIINILALLFVFMILSVQVFATGSQDNSNRYYLGIDSLVNAGKDTGYSEENEILEKDPHYGFDMGSFYIDGYTRTANEDTENPVFLKNVGDNVTLWFSLNQNIYEIDGQGSLSISEDKNGYYLDYGIEKTNFGRGTLIIRYIDYQNKPSEPQIYTDYFAAHASESADTKVQMLEEGDYEVCLLYEIKDDPRNVLDISILPSYKNYKKSFKFSVRNGNCMIFPFDVETGIELNNTAISENGFYLNLANSRYLDINVRKEVLKDGESGLVEDTRFNRPAKDGEGYTDEGIYTIKVTNNYTDETTEKKIYVGDNNLLKAHVTTGLEIKEIDLLIKDGATIASDGTIDMGELSISKSKEIDVTNTEIVIDNNNYDDANNNIIIVFILIGIFICAIVGVIVLRKFKMKSQEE